MAGGQAMRPGLGRHKRQGEGSVPEREFVAESLPIVAEFAANLTYPTRADAVLTGQIEGSLAHRHVVDDPPIPVRPGVEPRWEIEPELHLVGDWRPTVIDQSLE